ncbi:hypothetical protein [Klebsiella spallanzanii]|uniref:hypothetical protein n=1 Tax=Klebsiella spallanzanii TaxID=2587528 RepID=UPI00116DF0F6|nr:hypothetical protein [Klebsiella spallanzanii]VUS37359.1 hypothetical protein SB6419_02596 [Klebsiella spallanzanii]
MLKKSMISAGIFLLLSSGALACSGRDGSSFEYQKQGKGTIYVRHGYDFQLHRSVITHRLSHLPNVAWNQLGRVPNLADPDENRNDGFADEIMLPYREYIGWHFNWMTDGRHILWAGKMVQNPPGAPAVDAASFRAYGRFAADKHSLYFDGERTDDNPADNPLDMATLKEISGDLAEGDASDIVKDRHNLYYHGRRLGSADGFVLLGLKSWDQRGPLISYSSCEPARNAGPWDTLVRNADRVFINGEPLNADPDSFAVVRWMPGSLLIYRDKHGEKRYPYGRNCTDIFDIQLGKVTWRTRNATPRGNDCRVETLPNVDPEKFNVISHAMAQFKDRIYIVKDRDLLDQRLSIIKIADPELELDIGINVTDSNRAYVISEGNVRTVRTAGKMVRIKQPDGDFSPLFAHDDRYVYAFLEGDMWRYKTARPEAAYIDDFDDLIIDEGKYRLYGAESKFIPHGTAEKKR